MKKVKRSLLTLLALAGFTASALALPCYDRWQGCLAGGGGDDFCDGVWIGCMYDEYGYVAN